MSVKFNIGDGAGTGDVCSVISNSLLVSPLTYPPFGEQKIVPFRQYLTSNGLSTGASSMLAAGTLAAPISFYIMADSDNDIYITTLSFMLAGVNPLFSQFGAIAALTNGCRLYYTRESGQINFHTAIKSNFDLVRMCLVNPAFGNTTSVFLASNVVGTTDAYIPVLDITQIMPSYGVKLDRGTTQKLVMEIRDNTTTVSAFDCVAYGFQRIP